MIRGSTSPNAGDFTGVTNPNPHNSDAPRTAVVRGMHPICGKIIILANTPAPGIAQLAERVLSMHEVPDSISGFSRRLLFLSFC